MRKRPISITFISWLFIAVGSIGLIYHLLPQHQLQQGVIWVLLVRLLAVVCGVLMLLRLNWGRWLLVVWLAYHVGLSALHSAFQAAVHTLLFGVIVYLLFRAQASAYFRGELASTPEALNTS